MQKFLAILVLLSVGFFAFNCEEDEDSGDVRTCTMYDVSQCYYFEACLDNVCVSNVSGGGGGGEPTDDDDNDSACEPGARHCSCDYGICDAGLTCRSGICVRVEDDDDSADDDSADDDDTDDGWHDDTEQWIKTVRCCYLGALSDLFGAFAWSLHSGAWAQDWNLPITFNNDTGLSCYETQINMLDVYGNVIWTDIHEGPAESNHFLGRNYVPQDCWLSGELMERGEFDEADGIDGSGWKLVF